MNPIFLNPNSPGAVPEKYNNSIPGINVPYSKRPFGIRHIYPWNSVTVSVKRRL